MKKNIQAKEIIACLNETTQSTVKSFKTINDYSSIKFQYHTNLFKDSPFREYFNKVISRFGNKVKMSNKENQHIHALTFFMLQSFSRNNIVSIVCIIKTFRKI